MKRDYQMTEQLKGLLRTIFVRLSKGSSFSKTGITEKKLSETPRISFTKLYLPKVSFLGLSLFLSTFLAAQCPADLNVSNGNTGTWTNTTGGDATVRITAVGGGGGKNTAVNFPGQGQVGTLFGGSGATMIGTFVVPPGVTLFAISGQAGVSTVNAGSGGGGSGVVSCGNPQNCANGTILILAGGGGGSSGFLNGQGGQITQGSGNGGNSLSGAAGGGGLNSAGQIGVPTQGVTVIAYGGGQVSKVAISNGGTAGTRYGITGAAGGNGMGGGGATGGDLYASGGGGYSGGNGEHDDYIQGAGGGGSFNSGASQANTPGTAGGGANPGSVLIECLSFVPNCTTPTAYSVTGGGSYCTGGPGVAIGLSNSETGVNYQLKIGGVNTGGTFPGTNGTAISFGNQTVAGNYTVEATTATGGCTNTMTGSVNVSITPDVGTPSFTSGATSLCAGGTSTYAATASDASSIVYSILNGTGASIDANSGVVSNVTGNYTVVATASGTCGPNTTANRVVTVTPFTLSLSQGADSTKANGTLVNCNGPYTVYYRRLNGGHLWSSISTASASFTLTNLVPASNYIAYAQNANGTTTANTYITTSGWLPCGNAITGVTANIICNQLTVNWNPAPSGTTYTVSYREVSPALGAPVSSTSSTNSKTFTLPAAMFGKTLEIIVFYTCNNQYTPASVPTYITVNNSPIPQGAPVVSASAVTCSGFSLSWQAISNALSYRVLVRNSLTNTVSKNVVVTGTSTTITGLASNFTYSVTVTPIGCNNLNGTASSPISVRTCVGVIAGPNIRKADENRNPSLVVYPNPGEGIFNLTATGINTETTLAEIIVMDVLGKTIYTAPAGVESGSLKYEIDLWNMPAGTYFIKVKTGSEIVTEKILKQ